jgi:methionine synthase II (cobalamin-independent)
LAALGCRYIQVDDTSLAIICDPKNQQLICDRGEDPDQLISGHQRDRPKDMVVGVHMCRGNAGKGVGSGGYEPVAHKMFNDLAIDAFFMEYDSKANLTKLQRFVLNITDLPIKSVQCAVTEEVRFCLACGPAQAV